jgi:protein-tyrosine kinase
MLRTQVLQAMDLKAWQFVAVTSPAPGCGKTLTAVNLALSIARRSERSVMLVDMDLQKPQVAKYLGLKCDSGLVEVLNGQSALPEAIVRSQIAHQELLVLPTRASTAGSAELLASRAMTATLQQIKRDYPSRTIVLDLPPLLSSDDAIAVLPQVDCVLLVTAVGNTTVAQIEECSKHLLSADVVRVVLNKVPEADAKEYCYY